MIPNEIIQYTEKELCQTGFLIVAYNIFLFFESSLENCPGSIAKER